MNFLSRIIALSFSVGIFMNFLGVSATTGDLDDIHEHTHAGSGAQLFMTELFGEKLFEKGFWEDDHVLRFVSKTVPLSDPLYRPTPLVILTGASIDEAGRVSYLRADAFEALEGLADDFSERFSLPLTVVSGYRSASYQQRLWDTGRCTPTLCAPPGYSEHQLGLAVDVFDASTEEAFLASRRLRSYVEWMSQNAHLYGYTQSYKNGPDIDGYDVEPWHWRYVGIDMATRLYELDMSYTEYIEFESFMVFWRM